MQTPFGHEDGADIVGGDVSLRAAKEYDERVGRRRANMPSLRRIAAGVVPKGKVDDGGMASQIGGSAAAGFRGLRDSDGLGERAELHVGLHHGGRQNRGRERPHEPGPTRGAHRPPAGDRAWRISESEGPTVASK